MVSAETGARRMDRARLAPGCGILPLKRTRNRESETDEPRRFPFT